MIRSAASNRRCKFAAAIRRSAANLQRRLEGALQHLQQRLEGDWSNLNAFCNTLRRDYREFIGACA